MMVTLILKILSYLAPAGIVAFFFIRNNIKKNREHKKELDAKDAAITGLRNDIVNIIEIQGDIKDVDEQNKAIKKIITDSPDIDSAYADRLPDIPRKRTKRNKDT